jgi:molecular chaperone GrpE
VSESNGGAEKNGADEGVQEADIMPASEQSPLEQMMAERDKTKDQLLRTAADFDNFRKRTRKDIEESMRRGREDAVREILPVADNLERALAAAPMTAAPDALLDGVKMVLKLLQDSLERLGVTRIVTVGERFDPALHEAIQQVETTEHPMGTIVAELVPGYKNGERLVRAAMVAVARPPAKSE